MEAKIAIQQERELFDDVKIFAGITYTNGYKFAPRLKFSDKYLPNLHVLQTINLYLLKPSSEELPHLKPLLIAIVEDNMVMEFYVTSKLMVLVNSSD